FGGEGLGLPGAELADRVRVVGQEAAVLGEAELAVLGTQGATTGGGVGAQVEQFLRRHRVPADAVEPAQQPRVLFAGGAVVPDLGGAADELVAAWALHTVDAQIGAADADRVLRGPGAGRVVLGGDQPVARVGRGGDRRAEVDVAEPEHQVFGGEDGVEDVGHRVQSVHAADELDVPRAPGRVRAHAVHVADDGLAGGRVVPGQRQVHGAAGHHQFPGPRQRRLGVGEQAEQARRGQPVRVDAHLQRPYARGEFGDAGLAALEQVLVQGVYTGAQAEIEGHLAVFDQHAVVAGAPVGDGGVLVGLAAAEHAVVAVAAGGEHDRPVRAPGGAQFAR